MSGSYEYLGKRGPITGAIDRTGFNTGNWTIAFTPAVLSFTVPEILVYKIQTRGAIGSSFSVYVEAQQWDSNLFGNQNTWVDDGGDSLVIRTGEGLYLCYSDPITDGTPPVATVFVRFDLAKWGKQYGKLA